MKAATAAKAETSAPPSATATPNAAKQSLPDARRGFATKLRVQERDGEPAPEPPPGEFLKVRYPSDIGELTAYTTVPPKDGKRHPAIVWITGGDSNRIDEVWIPGPRDNEQTARAYRDAGIVMMFPSLRGGHDNPGARERFFGEVDDVIAAGEYLRTLDHVDPNRIYLGGHSTGGTLVLLVAESTDRFRAVFSFGPTDDVRAYLPEYAPYDLDNPREFELRSPLYWLDGIRVPTYAFEGMIGGNADVLKVLGESTNNARLNAIGIAGVDHFSVLAPMNELIAKEILADVGDVSTLEITDAELAAVFR